MIITVISVGTRGPLEVRFPQTSGYEQTGSKFNGDYEKMFKGLKSNVYFTEY